MKKRTLTLTLPLIGIAATSLAASEHLFNFAFKRVNYVPETSADKQKYADAYYAYVDWYQHVTKEKWYLHEHDPKNRMVAEYIPAATPSQQTVIISHGYKGNGETMANFAQMYHHLGFNVLLPDDRGHGESAGKYISFGWLDRLDYLQWIQQVIDRSTADVNILLFGVSMGGATMEMLSGETLPPQVKAIIADCGYSSIEAELTYLLKRQFHLPKYPIEPLVSTISKRRLGYYLGDVTSTDQLRKNTRPILFIHGEKDVYVPVGMAYENYAATHAPKQLWIVKNASHAESFWMNPERYQQRVTAFLQTYFK
ncbi:alpha/beta hydrolase [Levilactobacillus brevis]|uniref:alpha/beta hydrolase n=1 Tax=Levilactobacillus brevis TaxID=1580 RepID=UPI000A20AACD|nr:alpha/beta hydrolase [Levilactobacillus brevis]ARN90923.1 hydrolase [Levilactobacillus brevis]ARN98554.1 alpha/beta hydrolase [Levilactobacillus brevis]MCT3566028.1 alpha/beta hydrolase [Levilactobacillus brevis]TOY86051.1 alpha/beta hydrolase [Levilactobacillus brevis]HJD99123.1 alpha/beta hydrolase [Levilactobacillus brevis]